jgi:hypothetical protein
MVSIPEKNGDDHGSPGVLARLLGDKLLEANRLCLEEPARADGHPRPLPSPGGSSRDSRVAGFPRAGPAAEVRAFLGRYVVLPEPVLTAIAAWVLSAWLADLWDRFPHLGITSPEGRCGKTRLLELLEMVCPNARQCAGTSAPALFRKIAKETPLPTILLDEAQCLSRRGSESSEMLREMFCAGIGRKAAVSRCVGQDHVPTDFPIYCPKAVALIGTLDGVLADRCLPIPMKRKTKDEGVRRCRLRVIEEEGKALHDRLAEWAGREEVREEVKAAYDALEPLDINNDRMAELFLPLQAVLSAGGGTGGLKALAAYARGIEEAGRNAGGESPGVLLLAACREIFAAVPPTREDGRFVPTKDLIDRLVGREEEPWARYTREGAITDEALARLLRPYGIRSRRNRTQTARGYCAGDFEEAWRRYLPDPPRRSGEPGYPPNPVTGRAGNLANPANPADGKGGSR